MLNPTNVNFTGGINPLIQGYDFTLVLEDNTIIGTHHVDLAHIINNPDGTLGYATSNFPEVSGFQNQNIVAKINAYGPNGAVSAQASSPIMVFIFLDPPTNIFLS